MKKELIIIGASDSGLEIFSWASPHFSTLGFHFKGYIDDVQSGALSTIVDYIPVQNDVFVCSLGSPDARAKCCAILREKGANFINLIHPSAIVLSDMTSTGVVIAPFVYVGNKACIANDVFMNISATVGHDVIIGQSSVLSPRVGLMGHVVIGDQVFLGSNACVIPGKRIGDHAVIGAGSAVIRHVVPGSTMVGVPAQKIF